MVYSLSEAFVHTTQLDHSIDVRISACRFLVCPQFLLSTMIHPTRALCSHSVTCPSSNINELESETTYLSSIDSLSKEGLWGQCPAGFCWEVGSKFPLCLFARAGFTSTLAKGSRVFHSSLPLYISLVSWGSCSPQPQPLPLPSAAIALCIVCS